MLRILIIILSPFVFAPCKHFPFQEEIPYTNENITIRSTNTLVNYPLAPAQVIDGIADDDA